jgi:hypothetical protein
LHAGRLCNTQRRDVARYAISFCTVLFAILKAYGAGALIAMTAETMIPEAFHNGPRYSGVLAAAGFAVLILLGELAW